MKRQAYLYLLPLLFLFSCATPQPPEFKRIENVQVGLDGNDINLQADALLFNPNMLGLTLKEANLQLFLDGQEVGMIDQPYNIEIQAQSDFRVPFSVSFPVSKLKGNFFEKALSFLGKKKKMEAEFKGFVKVKAHGVLLTIPIQTKQEIKI